MTIRNSLCNVRFATNTGELLAEVVRAHLHTANPSAALGRVSEGLLAFARETTDLEMMALLDSVTARLNDLQRDVAKQEDDMWGPVCLVEEV